jgi:hypothetical protein
LSQSCGTKNDAIFCFFPDNNNSDSYNVEEEVFTVAFSKRHPEVIKITPVQKPANKKREEKVPTV